MLFTLQEDFYHEDEYEPDSEEEKKALWISAVLPGCLEQPYYDEFGSAAELNRCCSDLPDNWLPWKMKADRDMG